MSDVEPVAPAPEPSFAPTLPPETGAISVMDAARIMREQRAKAAEPEDKPRERAPDGKFAAKESPPSEGEDAGPDNQVPGETVQDDQAELPPIDPPRSWSKEDKELFNALPRETQERVSERERARESDFLKRQNEAAETSKALKAKEQAAEQARQQYETAAQNALQVLQSQMTAEFADIKTIADVQKLAETDPFRFAQFQARQMQMQAQANEVENLQRQKADDERKAFETWSKEQDDTFVKQFPEFADEEKAAPLQKSVVSYLTNEIGVPKNELADLYNSRLFRDAKFQRVVYDASRFHAAQQKAKAAVAVPKPAPQRPGVAPDKNANVQDAINAAQARLKNAKGIDAVNAGVELLRARRQARR